MTWIGQAVYCSRRGQKCFTRVSVPFLAVTIVKFKATQAQVQTDPPCIYIARRGNGPFGRQGMSVSLPGPRHCYAHGRYYDVTRDPGAQECEIVTRRRHPPESPGQRANRNRFRDRSARARPHRGPRPVSDSRPPESLEITWRLAAGRAAVFRRRRVSRVEILFSRVRPHWPAWPANRQY